MFFTHSRPGEKQRNTIFSFVSIPKDQNILIYLQGSCFVVGSLQMQCEEACESEGTTKRVDFHVNCVVTSDTIIDVVNVGYLKFKYNMMGLNEVAREK